MPNSSAGRLAAIFAGVLMAASMLMISAAEARMGGSFGSRGLRTFHSAPVTRTAPHVVSPIQRSMTTHGTNRAAPATRAPENGAYGGYGWRPGLWGFGGGLVGGLLGGLFLHGLLGSMLGYGWGGIGGGLFSTAIQLVILFFLISWAVKFFRRRAAASGGPAGYEASPYETSPYEGRGSAPSGGGPGPAYPGPRQGPNDEIGITDHDLETFENRLAEVQDAFSSEDHAGLRRLTTPEMVSFLSEELADNATKGLRNEVRNLKFLQGDVAEAWREGDREYATVALRWSAIDVMRRRESGEVVKGDPDEPVQVTELWTFVRERGGDWLLSAIQGA